MNQRTQVAWMTMATLLTLMALAVLGYGLQLMRTRAAVQPLEEQLWSVNVVLNNGAGPSTLQVRSWLESDPAYQALARNLIVRLNGNRLKGQPLPLPLINGNYKKKFGVGSAEPLSLDKYTDGKELTQALLDTWSEVNKGENPSSLEQITESRNP